MWPQRLEPDQHETMPTVSHLAVAAERSQARPLPIDRELHRRWEHVFLEILQKHTALDEFIPTASRSARLEASLLQGAVQLRETLEVHRIHTVRGPRCGRVAWYPTVTWRPRAPDAMLARTVRQLAMEKFRILQRLLQDAEGALEFPVPHLHASGRDLPLGLADDILELELGTEPGLVHGHGETVKRLQLLARTRKAPEVARHGYKPVAHQDGGHEQSPGVRSCNAPRADASLRATADAYPEQNDRANHQVGKIPRPVPPKRRLEPPDHGEVPSRLELNEDWTKHPTQEERRPIDDFPAGFDENLRR
mmetsp:Transcript_74506/g.206979  ORF Transcript_74506/g.206979 Transcript_74506/m.206979 type:complete len:307 (-) Transcript_74506:258-1178(-)